MRFASLRNAGGRPRQPSAVGRVVVVTGTGTGIGKTHLTEALLVALGHRGARVVGFKPVETGFDPGDAQSDSARLERASTFHVKQSGQRFAPPVSPHLAARLEGAAIPIDDLAHQTVQLRSLADVVLVELAGGLFSPLSMTVLNADFARTLGPHALVLVAPDRLGVLHDVIAATRAARADGLVIDALVLSPPAIPDASSGSNAAELAHFVDVPTLLAIPRGPVEAVASASDVQSLCDVLVGSFA
jgi:dethiobiotin synthetase